MSKIVSLSDLQGRKFGRLSVISEEPSKIRIRQGKSLVDRYFLCRCDCGNTKVSSFANLGNGVKSCGCLRSETGRKVALSNVTHGMSSLHPGSAFKRTPEYAIWNTMISRCIRPKASGYEGYGGRGISVFDRWLHSFENFLLDMGSRPSAAHSIERINSDGNYQPDNCRWATAKEQTRNTSQNVFIEYMGKSQCLMDWAIETGIKYYTLRSRIRRGIKTPDLFNPVTNPMPSS